MGWKAQGLSTENQAMGDCWIHDSSKKRLSESCYGGVRGITYFKSALSAVDSLDFVVETDERRRVCRFSSRMGIRDSHSSTNPAVPRGPQVERLMVGFFWGLATMGTFS